MINLYKDRVFGIGHRVSSCTIRDVDINTRIKVLELIFDVQGSVKMTMNKY
jgi:hypothetical protein